MPTLRWVKRDPHAGAGGASAGDKRPREEENAAAVAPPAAVTSGAEVNAASSSTMSVGAKDLALPLVKSGNPDWSLLTVLGSFLLPHLVQYDQATGQLTVVEGMVEEFLPEIKAKVLPLLLPHRAEAFKARTTSPPQYKFQMKEMGWIVSKSSDGSLVYRHQHGFGAGKDAATHWRSPKEQRSRLKKASLAKQVGVAEHAGIVASPSLTPKRPRVDNAVGPAAASGTTATAVRGHAETLRSQQLHEKGGEEMRAAMKRRQAEVRAAMERRQEEMRAAMERRQQREKEEVKQRQQREKEEVKQRQHRENEEMKQRHRKEQEELDRLVLKIRASKAGSGDLSFFEEDADTMELH